MSHMVTIQARFTSHEALVEACGALDIPEPKEGSYSFFDGEAGKMVEKHGQVVRLNGWQKPVVIDDDGVAHFDNYGNAWGHIDRMHELRQQYAVAAVTAAAGPSFMIQQTQQDDGAIRLVLSA